MGLSYGLRRVCGRLGSLLVYAILQARLCRQAAGTWQSDGPKPAIADQALLVATRSGDLVHEPGSANYRKVWASSGVEIGFRLEQ